MDIIEGSDGRFPHVHWIQMLPKTTRGARLRWQAIGIGMAVGTVIGAAALGWEGFLWGTFFGGGLGGILFQKSMQSQGQQEWAARPVLVPSQARAVVKADADGELIFAWSFDTPDGGRLGDTVPVSSFDVFEFGSLNEWFSGPDDRNKYGDCSAIVLHAAGLGTKCVAAHGGTRAEMAQLHATLTRQFILNRSAWLKPDASRYSDEIPRSL